MAQTKHTLREILERLKTIGLQRPEDQTVILDVMNIINHHVTLIDRLKKLPADNGQTKTLDVARLDDVLFS